VSCRQQQQLAVHEHETSLPARVSG
jgi:hypothetical protein